jgi:hypothetical protein
MDPKPVDKKKTVKLRIESQPHYNIVGISSHENDYRLVWSMNEQLKMQFIRTTNLTVYDPKVEADLEFSRYIFNDEERYLKYEMLSNRCDNGFLFPEIKNVDYLLLITGELSHTAFEGLIKKTRKIDIVSTAFAIQAVKLKNLSKLSTD